MSEPLTGQTPEAEEEKRLTAFEILKETIEYYAQGGRFAVTEAKKCVYLDPQTGNRCAVGRCLIPGIHDDSTCTLTDLVINGKFSDEHLEPRYRGQTDQFWRLLQNIHDMWASHADPSCKLGRLCQVIGADPHEVLSSISFPDGKNPFLEYAEITA